MRKTDNLPGDLPSRQPKMPGSQGQGPGTNADELGEQV
jgi:hypothetical protein